MRQHSPQQREAIRKMMANRRRELTYIGGSFPKFEQGMTTRAYLELFGIEHRGTMLDFGPRVPHPKRGFVADLSHLDRPAPFYIGPEVVDESCDFAD